MIRLDMNKQYPNGKKKTKNFGKNSDIGFKKEMDLKLEIQMVKKIHQVILTSIWLLQKHH